VQLLDESGVTGKFVRESLAELVFLEVHRPLDESVVFLECYLFKRILDVGDSPVVDGLHPVLKESGESEAADRLPQDCLDPYFLEEIPPEDQHFLLEFLA